MRPAAVADRNWPANPAAQARALAEFLERHLRPHFAVEERIVFPAAREAGADVARLVSQLVVEHRSMIEAVQSLAADNVATAERLAAFGERLNAHIRLEDRTLFPLMETRLPAAALARLQAEVEANQG
jgi:iron-sulfur cluster repair protein YtfE (RIC family)